LIFGFSATVGIHSGETTKEVEIECEPNELAERIKKEKKHQEERADRIVTEAYLEDGANMVMSVSLKQVLQL
jgi:hypothetical protein